MSAAGTRDRDGEGEQTGTSGGGGVTNSINLSSLTSSASSKTKPKPRLRSCKNGCSSNLSASRSRGDPGKEGGSMEHRSSTSSGNPSPSD